MPPRPGCARGKVWLNPGQVHACAHGRIVAVPLPSDAAGVRKGAARAVPRHYCPLFTQSHTDASFLSHFFFWKEAGEGRGKAPEIPPPSAKKATSSPSPAAALTALTPFQARGQALSSV